MPSLSKNNRLNLTELLLHLPHCHPVVRPGDLSPQHISMDNDSLSSHPPAQGGLLVQKYQHPMSLDTHNTWEGISEEILTGGVDLHGEHHSHVHHQLFLHLCLQLPGELVRVLMNWRHDNARIHPEHIS